jgi:hypothetical protein
VIMSKTEEFIAPLHVIAAGDDPVDHQKDAVRKVLARFLREAREPVGSDQEPIRSWLEGVKLELDKQALQPRADRFADLRDHARTLVADWLRENPRA